MTITGLSSEPLLQETAGDVDLSTGGVTLKLHGVKLARSGRTWTITLP